MVGRSWIKAKGLGFWWQCGRVDGPEFKHWPKAVIAGYEFFALVSFAIAFLLIFIPD